MEAIMGLSETLTVSTAARHAAVSVSTIRRWMESGSLEFDTTKAGHRVTDKEALMRCLSQVSHGLKKNSSTHPKEGYRGASVVAISEMPENQNESLKIALEALSYERRLTEDLRSQNRELQSQILKIAAEMQAILSRDTMGKLSNWFRR
jgi:DNA-binding transcriptional MerR regulator